MPYSQLAKNDHFFHSPSLCRRSSCVKCCDFCSNSLSRRDGVFRVSDGSTDHQIVSTVFDRLGGRSRALLVTFFATYRSDSGDHEGCGSKCSSKSLDFLR